MLGWLLPHLFHFAGHWSAPVIAALLIVGAYWALVSFPLTAPGAIANRGAFAVALLAVGVYAFGVYAARTEKGREDAAALAEKDAKLEVYRLNEAKITQATHDTQVRLEEAEKVKAQVDVVYVDRKTEIVKQPIVECQESFGQMAAEAPKLSRDWRATP